MARWLRIYWQQLENFLCRCNGSIAIRKTGFEKIRWTNIRVCEDDLFNLSAVFKKVAMIDANLVKYRQHLSSREEVAGYLNQIQGTTSNAGSDTKSETLIFSP